MIEIRGTRPGPEAAHVGDAGVLVVGADETGPLLDGIPTSLLPLAARHLLEQWPAGSTAGVVDELPLPGSVPSRIVVAGLGAATPADLRLAGTAIARAGGPGDEFTVALPARGAGLSALVEGLALGAYRFRLDGERSAGLRSVRLLDAEAGPLARGLALAGATCWARDLANTPAATKTPAWLAEQAVAELTPLGVRVTVHDEQWLAEQGFGGVLAVGRGSAAGPRFVEASWTGPAARSAPHLVLVGKGITFDTGGLNIKPGDAMRMMHTDMAGGAAALGALRAIAQLRLRARVTVLVPIAQNSVSGSAMRPGDVIRHFGGWTSEVLNTDAEGRLVLADALAWAVDRLRPSALVDIATLTGAMKVALGLHTAGLLATSDQLAGELAAAAALAAEPVWRLPLPEEYAPMLGSDVADMNNAPGNPGGITAALFLRPFAAGVPWAHLDIAGPARSAADDGLFSRGATGFGARLLAEWMIAAAG